MSRENARMLYLSVFGLILTGIEINDVMHNLSNAQVIFLWNEHITYPEIHNLGEMLSIDGNSVSGKFKCVIDFENSTFVMHSI